MTELNESNMQPAWMAQLNALFMIVCLAGGGLAVILTGLRVTWPSLNREIMAGEWTSQYEQEMDGDFLTRDFAVAFWGAIEWGVFGEGRQGVVPGRDGWLFSIEEFEQPPEADEEIQRKLALIVDARNRLQAAGVGALVVALIPDKSRVYAQFLDGVDRRPAHAGRYPSFLASLHDAGIVAPDLLGPLQEAGAAGQTYMRTDTHWTPYGAQIAAEVLARSVAANAGGRVPSLQTEAYITDTGTGDVHRGDLTRFVPLGLFESWLDLPAEELQSSTTYKRDAPVEAEDLGGLLFADVVIPAALVGTSFSAMDEWNFDGALKQALGMDVLNLAAEGEGPMAPMAEYLNSDTLHATPPELVIWEIPERYLPVADVEATAAFAALPATPD